MYTRMLMPRYMLRNLRWAQLSDSIDELFRTQVDDPTEKLSYLNDLYPTVATPKGIVTNMISTTSINSIYSKQTLVKELEAMGLPLANSDRFDIRQLLRLRSVLPVFWQSDKGTKTLADLFSYALDMDLQISNLWLKNKDGTPLNTPGPDGKPIRYYDPEIHTLYTPPPEYVTGQSVKEVAGADFNYTNPKTVPTPYIELTYTPTDLDTAMSLDTLVQMLKELLNYNLVFKVIIANNPLHIRPQNRPDLLHPKIPTSDIISIAAITEIRYNMDAE